MKKALLSLVAILITSFCRAQEITKDGFGPLHWGASVAEAEKAFPGFGRKGTSTSCYFPASGTNSYSWMVNDGIPRDHLLWPKPGQTNPSVVLYFYNGKFVGLTSEYRTERVPTEAVGKSFDKDLRQRILKTLGDTDKIEVRVAIGQQTPDLEASICVRLQVSNKELVQSGLEDIKKRIEKQKEDLLTDVPKALLNP